MMEDNKTRVISWIRSGMDYYTGIQLLVEITHKQHFYGQFNGRVKSMSEKLAYEICKASGVADVKTWIRFIQEVKKAPVIGELSPTIGEAPETGKLPVITEENKNQVKVFIPAQELDTKREALVENPLKQYPPVIRRIIYEYASCFQERSKLHTVMVEMDQSNAPAVTEKRAELFDLIKALSVRLEEFYAAKEKFEVDGTLPIESELFPSDDAAPADTATLSEEELKKKKKNLQNSNSKDQSLLDYQSKEHAPTKNPMPAGPKRIKIEYRMKLRAKEIEEVDTALLKYVIKE